MISGAKNAVLPIIAASLLTGERVRLDEAPDLIDVEHMCRIIQAFGGKVERCGTQLDIEVAEIQSCEAPYEVVDQLRASIFVMGPLLARNGRVRINHPGGCAIGSRPINLHIKGLEALGAQVEMDQGFLDVKAKRLVGARIFLDFPSVGATENIMMAASAAQGVTTIENVAMEPEIVDLANFINELGGKVRGAGTSVIQVEGVTNFHGARHTVIPDRIEAGSYLLLAAATGGDVFVENVISAHLQPLLAKMAEAGIAFREEDDGIRVMSSGKFRAVDIKTQVHPGFPTDLQAIFLAWMTRAAGMSVVVETIFENRFMHVDELRRMGAEIRVEGRNAIIQGKPRLFGANVTATDLRAGAAMILAALMAEGVSEIYGVQHIDRGYENIVAKITALGGKISRLPVAAE
jgi:UDP-N-acetylglucosamine 1-carboxyvinyltransferase